MGVIFKGCEFINEGEINSADRTVTLFADYNFGYAASRIIFTLVVDFIPIEETDNIGILLNGSGFTQVRQLGPFVWPGFQAAVQFAEESPEPALEELFADIYVE